MSNLTLTDIEAYHRNQQGYYLRPAWHTEAADLLAATQAHLAAAEAERDQDLEMLEVVDAEQRRLVRMVDAAEAESSGYPRRPIMPTDETTGPLLGNPHTNLDRMDTVMPDTNLDHTDTTCPKCGQPAERLPALPGESYLSSVNYAAPEPQLWLCVDADGCALWMSHKPEWNAEGGMWVYGPHSEQRRTGFVETRMVDLLGVQPRQAVALHIGERLQGGDPHG